MPNQCFLFIIYIGIMMAKYGSKLNKSKKDNTNTIKIRGDNEEAKWPNHLYLENLDRKERNA